MQNGIWVIYPNTTVAHDTLDDLLLDLFIKKF